MWYVCYLLWMIIIDAVNKMKSQQICMILFQNSANIHIDTHTYVRTYMLSYTHIHPFIYAHFHMLHICRHTYIYTHTYVHSCTYECEGKYLAQLRVSGQQSPFLNLKFHLTRSNLIWFSWQNNFANILKYTNKHSTCIS